MENRIVIKNLKRQLHQVLLHEQVENDITINKNLNANKEDQQFVTPRKVFQTKHKHPWIEVKPTSHITPQVASIIPCEMQIGEAQRHTNNLQQNSKRKEH
jgi:adenine-specific DNA methylase